ncbi:TonB-dependent receptor [Desulfobulbus rhabdoformis]|uniref:TonB-dependent receptor plug domain-containing protein n=1 Tax=Desulfobulbus rhabdoformis TaxID=34032 RepID=UPI001963784E|nr:TonB-dependent receptor [Desulfobulbus rhabdoformis]MBM9616136.1 TonB-dependent receptor [Desulfobulbus rhabdoformis]
MEPQGVKKFDRLSLALLVCLASTTLAAEASGADQQDEAVKERADEMVVTATRSEEDILTIPTKIEVIDSHDIEMTAGTMLTEQLKKSSSISVIEYPGALAGIGIRGFRPEFSGITKHSLILLNGRPIGATNLATVLTDNVERIEVLKGPASSLYGAEAMGGVVNVITKKSTGPLGGSAELGYGSFETNFQKLWSGGAIIADTLDFDVSLGRHEQADNLTTGDNGNERPNTSYKTRNGAFRIGGNFAGDWRADLSANMYQGRNIETPGDVAYGSVRSGRKDIDNQGVDLRVGGGLGANNEVAATLYHTEEEAENYSNYSSGSTVPTYRSYDSEITWDGVQLQDIYTWGNHKFILGFDYQYIEKQSRSYTTSGTRKAPSSPDEGRTNLAGYLETVWKFCDNRLTFTGGGRYDTFEVETLATPYKTGFTPTTEDFSTFSPRVGANYLFDMGIRLHATVGQAFVPPSAFQLAGYSESIVGGVTMVTQGNGDLDPESSTTWDVGVGYELPNWGLSIDVTYFDTTVDDRITTLQVGNLKTYINALGADLRGMESTLSFDLGVPMQWKNSLRFYVNATHIFEAEEELAGGAMQDIHNVADYTYNYGVEYSDGQFDSRLHFRTVGPMRDTDWVSAGYPEIEYPSFTVVDLVLGYNFLEHHRVALTIDNLFDKDYYEKKGYPKPGQSFFLSYKYTF